MRGMFGLKNQLMMGLSLDIAQHVIGVHFENLSGQTINVMKRSLVDATGVALAASTQGQVTQAFGGSRGLVAAALARSLAIPSTPRPLSRHLLMVPCRTRLTTRTLTTPV